ncbi:MAG: DUF4435 domain-containing protein [Muribaculaceae bacterium]|nr:DUF4435 domain-containing protein [Muribaculaceae bacterium]MDE6026734.1 DUF4435 domain-containing protein [Muribaculaceae bacterium]
MNANKSRFYETAAKGFAASALLYKVESLVHVEDEDDIWFWQQILSKFRPGKYKFRPGSRNENDKYTTGCVQCLKYEDFLSQRFFICIDSDFRYLLNENISAEKGILQTYTYSWENHCCFAEKLQHDFAQLTGLGEKFDFISFLQSYSEIMYLPFLFMLHCERNGLSEFGRDKFRNLITLQYRKGDEKRNGHPLLERLNKEVEVSINNVVGDVLINLDEEKALYEKKGLTSANTYLYVRGHSLYNLLLSIGERLCEGTDVDFKHNILKSALSFNGYYAVEKIKEDVAILNTIRKTY